MASDIENRFSVEKMKAQISAVFKEAVNNDSYPEFEKCVKSCVSPGVENDVKHVIELSVREVLLDLLSKKANLNVLERVFQLSIDAALNDLCFGNLPALVLNDMFDGSTLNACEAIFDFVENRVDIFKKEVFFKTCKNHLLRSSNDLLRRLSRSQNTVFCGRIQLFLARLFPLSERSGLNIISEFNFDNTTVYSSKDEAIADFGHDKDDTVEEGEIIARPAADYNMYKKFWSLQDFFRNPNSCYNKVYWRGFINNAADILTVFGNFKSDDASSSRWKQTDLSSFSDGNYAYFAKYLTSPKLLELELSDSNFRRYILIQFLILFQYLSGTVKFKMESFVLSDDQQNWVKETTAKIYKLLEETPPDGLEFSKSVAKVLKREEYWNSWKNEGCPDFKSVECKIESRISRNKRRIGDELDPNNKVFIGNSELTKLWNICPNNWSACRTPERKFVPSLDEFFETAIEQADPANQVESQYKDVNDPKFAWKALRLLSVKSPHFFSSTSGNNVQFSNLSQYLETVITKIPRKANVKETTTDQGDPPVTEETLEEEEMFHSSEEESKEEVDGQKKPQLVTESQIEELSCDPKVQTNWKVLAKYLDFKDDVIEYFEDTYSSEQERAEKMMTAWFEQDPEGGSISTLKYALKNSDLSSVCSFLYSS